jgi:hypothetical protein
MNFNSKIDLKQKYKEREKPKSKQKYNSNNTKNLNQVIKPNKSKTSQTNRYFENILKGITNPNLNPNPLNSKNTNINNNYQDQIYDNEYILTQLLDKENDTYEDLKHKNKKLRELIIKVSKQLDILYTKYENIKINAENEKKILLEKLEKISSNYKLYAESYKENIKLKKEKDLLAENCSQINLVYNSCKNTLVSLIKKNMNYYTKLKMFYENKNAQFKTINFDDFIFSLKEEFLNNLIQYKNQLDIINFPSFYYEFNLFLNEECNYCNLKKQNIISKIQTDKNSTCTTYRQNISIKNERKENRTARLIKGNNSYDEYRNCKNKVKDKSPRINKNKSKKITLIRQKTPSKSNKYYNDLSFNKNNNNNKYFNKTLYNNQNINIVKEDEKNSSIFGDVGNIVNYNKKFSYKK